MKLFTIPITVRMTKETLIDIRYLLERYPELYTYLSDVVRCGVISLINQKHQEEEDEYRRPKNKFNR